MLLCGFFSRGSLNLVEVLSAKQHAYTTQQTAFPCAYEPKQQVEETKQNKTKSSQGENSVQAPPPF